MAEDVVAAVSGAAAIRRVLVVTADPSARTALGTRAVVVPDEPDAGLSAALRHGAEIAAARWPEDGVVAVAADLAALTSSVLDEVLSRCSPGRSVVADLAGTGTVLLAATPGSVLAPAYEGRSHEAHTASGAVDLSAYADQRLRRDVDTLADLEHAIRLGPGAATRRALDS
jgi:2-phospho-L-lactate guanylyltransferase